SQSVMCHQWSSKRSTIVSNPVWPSRPDLNPELSGDPGAIQFGGFSGHTQLQDAPGTEHTLTFHVNPGQVRYIRLDTRGSHYFVLQVYPELVDAAVGQAQTEKILKSG